MAQEVSCWMMECKEGLYLGRPRLKMALPKDSPKLDVPLHKFHKHDDGQCGMELHNDFGCSLDIFEEIWEFRYGLCILRQTRRYTSWSGFR